MFMRFRPSNDPILNQSLFFEPSSLFVRHAAFIASSILAQLFLCKQKKVPAYCFLKKPLRIGYTKKKEA